MVALTRRPERLKLGVCALVAVVIENSFHSKHAGRLDVRQCDRLTATARQLVHHLGQFICLGFDLVNQLVVGWIEVLGGYICGGHGRLLCCGRKKRSFN